MRGVCELLEMEFKAFLLYFSLFQGLFLQECYFGLGKSFLSEVVADELAEWFCGFLLTAIRRAHLSIKDLPL